MLSHGTAGAWSPRVFAVVAVVDEGEVDVVVLGLAAHAKSSGLDTREDDTHELAEGRGVERNYAVGTAAFCVFRVDAIAWDGCFRGATNGP